MVLLHIFGFQAKTHHGSKEGSSRRVRGSSCTPDSYLCFSVYTYLVDAFAGLYAASETLHATDNVALIVREGSSVVGASGCGVYGVISLSLGRSE
jgi:hypothetical protein